MFTMPKKNINSSFKFFSSSSGIVTRVSDEIVYCVGLPSVKFGEVVNFYITSKLYSGLVIGIS